MNQRDDRNHILHSDLLRFEEKASPPNHQGCRLWLGAIGSDGYGHLRMGKKVIAAHRVAFFIRHGRYPKGSARHSCDEPLCVEADHLIDGTHKENMEDCVRRGRNRSPRAGNGFDKLGSAGRALIREAWAAGERNKSLLSRRFGVTPSRIRQIVTGR